MGSPLAPSSGMDDERAPALSAGARMHPVHPDDVRIADGRERAARARRKVSSIPLSSVPSRTARFACGIRASALYHTAPHRTVLVY
eukprot:COSAG02_NODE_646_length_18945_cov_17.654462_5_plen_86_part_00